MLPKRGQDDIECETVVQYFDISKSAVEGLKYFAAQHGVPLRQFMLDTLLLGFEAREAKLKAGETLT